MTKVIDFFFSILIYGAVHRDEVRIWEDMEHVLTCDILFVPCDWT